MITSKSLERDCAELVEPLFLSPAMSNSPDYEVYSTSALSEGRHRPRGLAQNHYLFSPNRGNLSLQCPVPPSIALNLLQSNGLERNSAPQFTNTD